MRTRTKEFARNCATIRKNGSLAVVEVTILKNMIHEATHIKKPI